MTSSCTRRRRASLGIAVLAGISFIFALASAANAQVVSDPRMAEFDPSPDHWQTLDNGEPAVVRYELGVYMLGASEPFAKIDMGKPDPEADGKIRYDFSSGVSGWPLTGSFYEARVSAVGPEGAALSDPSNPFVFGSASSCDILLSATAPQVPASGGDYAVDVFTGTGCSWTAGTALSWITLWTSSGSGNGTVAFALKPNTTTSSRAGVITIGGQTLTISQQGLAVPATSWAKPAAIAQGTPLGAAQLNAIASVPGAFVYSPAAGTVLASGTHTLKATFTPNDTTLYAKATASTTITVGPTTYQLTVSRPSGGTVYSAGINCGTSTSICRVTMSASMPLGLWAAADKGYAFAGWTGDCAGTSPSLTLQLSGAKSCGATFSAITTTPSTSTSTTSPTTPSSTTGGTSTPPSDGSALPLGAPYTLTIVRPSGGVVKAAGINCGTGAAACAVTMPAPMTVGVQATADPGYVFAGWTGHCSGTTASQAMALEGPRTCGATFAPAGAAASSTATSTSTPTTTSGSLQTGAPYTLTIGRPAGGTIQAAGINCGTKGTQCSVTMPAPMWLGLQATPDAGYRFIGWSGQCSGTEPGYALVLAGPRSCTATFTAGK
jgi:uncharacterized repeat protein (TIGR02543 family)